MSLGHRLSKPANGVVERMRYLPPLDLDVSPPQGDLSPRVALLGLLLDQSNGSDVRGMAEKAPIGVLVVELAGVVALIARRFSTAGIDEI